VCKKIDYKFSTVCEKNEKISGPLGGIFLTHTVQPRTTQKHNNQTRKYA